MSTGPHRAYIAFGSNQRDPLAQLLRARRTLALHPDLREIAASPLYRTPPFGITAQPDFLNAVCLYETSLAPRCLLAAINAVEAAQDRVRAEKNGPRTLDLDILLYDDCVLHEERLTIPHPGLPERAFVLAPLADIAADLVIPGENSVAELLSRADKSGVVREEIAEWENFS